MKIKEIKIKNFKRFTNLTVTEIPETAKLVVLVGPNGCGKTSLFEAFNHWYKLKGFNNPGNSKYYLKKESEDISNDYSWYIDKVIIDFFEGNINTKEQVKGKFYFRSAYRNEPEFITSSLNRQEDPTSRIDHETLMSTDKTVSSNYQRLISSTLSGVFNESNNQKTVEELRKELIGKIQKALMNVFENLELSSIGDPLVNGSFYFTKGVSKDFPYSNLSAGEKSAFDLLLDLIIKSMYFNNTVYCIDEPESHMHTALQSKLLGELYSLIPENSQLWISTHSMGMLKKAKELEEQNPGTVVFLDFENRDFDSEVVITPSKIDATMWKRFLDLAFGDLSSLIAPSTIVFCEGTPQGRAYKDFDAQVYKKIFSSEYPDVCFSSVGSCTELANPDNVSMKIISNILGNSQMIKLVDRDARSEEEIAELNQKNIKVLSKRHIECYLLDDEILTKLCNTLGKSELITDVMLAKQDAINESIGRGNANDDIKSAAGKIFTEVKRILQINRGGNTKDAFFRDTLVPLITPDTHISQELKQEIFG